MTRAKPSLARKGIPTVFAALEDWEAQTEVPFRKKRRVRQDVMRACELFGLDPKDVLAHSRCLNPLFGRVSLGANNISAKRLTNLRHSCKTLLRSLPTSANHHFDVEISPDWAVFEDRIPTQYLMASVRCIMKHGTALGIPPPEFKEVASASLLEALRNDRLSGKPEVIHQNAIRASNRLRKASIGWAVPYLKPPQYGRRYIKRWHELPAWCEQVAKAFIDRSTTTDPFDLSKPFKKWRPETTKTYDTLLRRFFSVAQRVHPNFDSPRTFAEVATFNFAEPVLRWVPNQHGGKRGWVMISAMALLLGQIAKNPLGKLKLTDLERKQNDENVAQLFELSTRLFSNKGLSQKSRQRVSPFKDEVNLAKLFLLPFALEREIKRSKIAPRKLALLVQLAVALALLTFCPLRMATLSRLADRHLKWSRPNRRGELTLEIEAELLKNNEPQSIPLPPECARIIKLYIEKFRCDLFGRDAKMLFPGVRLNEHKNTGCLSMQISALIYNRTGFTVNPHLYRHLVHIVVLRKMPGAYTMISRILTHNSLETAVKNYAHFDIELSMREYHKLIREVQSGARSSEVMSEQSIAFAERGV